MINGIIDLDDDPSGSILKSKIPSFDAIPDFIKTAEKLTSQERDKLPDNVFALVMLDGGQKMRKYACVDKGNTALSVIYFLENRDRLPEEAQKVAAANLKIACGWYDMTPPLELSKVAFLGRKSREEQISEALAYSQKQRDDGVKGYEYTTPQDKEKTALLGAAMNAAMVGSSVSSGHKQFKQRQQALKAGVPGSEAVKLSDMVGSNPMPLSQPAGEKTSGLERPELPRAREVFPGRGPENRVKRDTLRKEQRAGCPLEKKSSLNPYVDVTGKKAPVKLVKEAGQRFCLNGKYPIDSMQQVEKAASYFSQYKDRFTPFERHQYCVKLASRASDLGMKMSEEIQKYGSSSMATDAGVAVYRRQRLFREGTSEHSLLDEMREKCASVRPEVMAVALENFDRSKGLDKLWDKEIPDPYYSIFGMEKVAEWSFTNGNQYINEERLRNCAESCYDELKEHFGEEIAGELRKDPLQIFDSLPLDHKRIIMNISQAVEE